MLLTHQFDTADLRRWFAEQDLRRGRTCVDAVQKIATDAGRISSWVQGSERAPYRVRIDFLKDRRGELDIHASCTCPVGSRCKHAAATLLAALATRQPAPEHVRPGVFEWVEQLKAIASAVDTPGRKKAPRRTHAIGYLLERESYQRQWRVRLLKASLRAEGDLGLNAEDWGNVESALLKAPSFVDENDLTIFRLLLAQRGKRDYIHTYASFPLVGAYSDELLRRMLESGRLYAVREARHFASVRLDAGDERPGRFAWEENEHGTQATFQGEPPIDAAIPAQPPWYIDFALRRIGRLKIDLPASLLPHLASIPPLNREEAAIVAGVLKKIAPSIPLPSLDTPPLRQVKAPLRAVFKVSRVGTAGGSMQSGTQRDMHDVAVARFFYDDVLVPPQHEGNYLRLADGSRVSVDRDFDAEEALLDGLYEHGFNEAPPQSPLIASTSADELIYLPEDDDLWFDFVEHIKPALEADGWEVELPADFRYQVREADAWFADLDDADAESTTGSAESGTGAETTSSQHWFSLSLGIVVDGKKYALAPLIHELLRNFPGWSDKHHMAAIPDDLPVNFRLDDGTRLRLPAGRLKPLIATMIDILDAPGNAPLKVSRFDLPRIIDATAGTTWQRSGAEKARQIAEALRGSVGVQPVDPPPGFLATLRPYQKEGLAWLQYLRAHALGGILADDMGLGKTAQALAHLLVEKQAGRLGRIEGGAYGPALVVLPTSLVFNWKLEAARFAPDLKVLSLHGAERKERFSQIPEHDIVLTTYPLLWRDADLLKEHAYHTLLLDEAQTVKNAASLAAKTVRTLNAKYRLCLTGTPLENHLGELWAQFDFLMPGLLGDTRSFTGMWRVPIEKRGDTVRRDILARRLKPFILRRKKDDVAKELPAKTIIQRAVELDGGQRDLYEIVRATMDSKVRQEIASKGFARSRIIILDALLKLRQVCCDPRLLKFEAAKKVRERAKLDLLMDMLPELVDEGRRILVFSQFTGMLDLIEPELHKAKLEFVRLSGETKNREAPINRFQNGEVPIFLISLKAGGLGLNLTAADTVIHYDPWWNPAVENQATDRAHRIGQTKQVFVYKLIVAGSIEEKILALQEKKAALAEGILSDDAEAIGKFSESDIAALLAPLPR